MAKNNTTEAVKVCVDSCVVLAYLLGDQPQHAEGIRQLFYDVEAKKARLYGSILLLAEVLGGSAKGPTDPRMDERVGALLLNPASITLIQAGVQVGMVARGLRREFGLKVADSLHLASAVVAKVEVFSTTNSKDFPMGRTVQGVLVDFPRSPSGNGYLPSGG